MHHVCVHAFVESCLPLEKGGMFKLALLFVTKSLILKPVCSTIIIGFQFVNQT